MCHLCISPIYMDLPVGAYKEICVKCIKMQSDYNSFLKGVVSGGKSY